MTSVCDSVQVQEPTQDESVVEVTGITATQGNSWNKIVADVEISNNITSGDGVEITESISVTIEDSSGNLDEVTKSVTVSPGSSVTETYNLSFSEGAVSGEATINACAGIVN